MSQKHTNPVASVLAL